jgi:hypothetical protein
MSFKVKTTNKTQKYACGGTLINSRPFAGRYRYPSRDAMISNQICILLFCLLIASCTTANRLDVVWEKASTTEADIENDELVCNEYAERKRQENSRALSRHSSAIRGNPTKQPYFDIRFNGQKVKEFCMQELGYIKGKVLK